MMKHSVDNNTQQYVVAVWGEQQMNDTDIWLSKRF